MDTILSNTAGFLQALIGLFFSTMGILKLTPSGGPDGAIFQQLHLPRRVLRLSGVVNILGGMGLLAGFGRPLIASGAGLLLCGYLIWAIIVIGKSDPADTKHLSVLLAMCIVITFVHSTTFLHLILETST